MTVYYSGTLGNNTILYATSNSSGGYANLYWSPSVDYYVINGYSFYMNSSGQITSYSICSVPHQISGIHLATANNGTVCSNAATSVWLNSANYATYVSNGNLLSTGMTLWISSAVNVPVTGYVVVFDGTGSTFNLNSSTGVIGDTSGVTQC